MNTNFTLYHYWRSSASWRVRWAISHKNISCDYKAINLLTDETDTLEHRKRSPMGYVPVLEINENGEKKFLTQSLAIIDYLEAIHPEKPLLPKNPYKRAQVWALAELINADTAPLQNLPPQFMYSENSPEKRKEWAAHWIKNGLNAFEQMIQTTAGAYSYGDQLTLADLCLIPQVYNALRYEVDLNPYPKIKKIYEAARLTESCTQASPETFEPKSK